MCGIAGSINFKLSAPVINKAMGHRGPDERNAFSDNNLCFYHLRLSILDISGGAQPMHLDNRYSIIFNGEIYNHTELRERFNLKGNTHSDTETLLLLYRKMGASMLNELDGMFTFCIYDKQEGTIFLARDRAGVKPLYIYEDGEKFVFASELNCLKALLPLQKKEDAFYHYLRLGCFYRTHTPYKNVSEMPGGTYLIVHLNNLDKKETRWWNIHPFYLQNQKRNLPIEEAISHTDHLLHTAIKRRIDTSDLEVGCFLSGGIDSGLVTSIANQYKSQLKTFTISFPGSYDEAPLAKQVAEKYGTIHHEIGLSFDSLRDDVETILANYGEPFFDSSAIPSYYVSREAKKHLTVILNGDGADELFGGYRRYVPFAKYDFFNKSSLMKGLAGAVSSILPNPKDKKSSYNFIHRLASLASKSGVETYLTAGVDILEGFEKWIIPPAFDYLLPVKQDFTKITGSPISGLAKIMNMDFDCNLFSDLLVKMDIATMAHSLEGRSPFLAKELLEFAPSLPDSFKINNRKTKYLLRRLSEKYLPHELVNQPKRGFEVPLKSWVNNTLRDMIFDYLSDPNALYHAYFRKKFGSLLLERKLKMPEEKRAKVIWMLFAMEVWNKKVYLQQ
ncbi:MAG: asparagine synthase (glutamine-hydrolyzing) [Bacteroidetes bacterium]|nr:asparagine synthase (glutamine-hydrolyzing) [Bacteroidota bacterium]